MDKPERARLVKQRGFHKAAITRIETFFKNIDIGSQDQFNIHQITTRLTWSKYVEVQMELETNDDDSSHSNDIEEVEEKYLRIKGGLQKLLDDVNKREIKPSSSGHFVSPPKIQAVQLPTINLPTFNGDLTQWVHFRDIFQSLIIDNDSLSNIQRLHYLNSSLVGEAKDVIETIPLSESNFVVAWDLVFKRFNNPTIIVNNHIRNLLTLPSITRESASELRMLINQVKSNINAIEALKEITIPLHDLIIIQLILQNLDLTTKKAWGLYSSGTESYNLSQLLLFLEERCQALETLQSSESKTKLTVRKTEKKLLLKSCAAQGCRKCGLRHHTLLHKNKFQSNNYVSQSNSNIQTQSNSNETVNDSKIEEDQGNRTSNSYCSLKNANKDVLLATAVVHVRDKVGHLHECRVLLDSASQSNFVTESFVQRLRLPKHKNPIPIQGINDVQSKTNHCVTIDFQSRHSPFKRVISCSVLPKITGTVPNSQLNCDSWNLPTNINLADPGFHCPGQIDLLIGAELYFELLIPNNHLVNEGYPTLINTHLGWILSGVMPSIDNNPNQSSNHALLVRSTNLHDLVSQFWETEEICEPVLTTSENECEKHFCENTVRDSTGRYVVSLPLSKEPTSLGDSMSVARNRFFQLERRLMKNSRLCSDYINFMEEYESMKHMKEVKSNNTTNTCYYIPHHPVFKADSSTTKMRVVFDASSKTSTDTSLNDILHVGPTIQEDLYSIILRFRTHQVAFSADIAKMYRQIKVNEEDTNLQRIIWRKSPMEPIREYELTTVTYGTACAPFLAIRCLKQLEEDEGHNYPKAAELLKRDMYVDDCISGATTVEEALDVQKQLIKLLELGGFPLRKWCSNHTQILEAVPECDRESQLPLRFSDESSVKTLGLLWDPASDRFQISNHDWKVPKDCFTKRIVLSIISSIFDPLGFVSPVVITCKIFLQKLWESKIQWDEELPHDLEEAWKSIYEQLSSIKEFKIDRLVLSKGFQSEIQIHGFCDASERAFGACFYVRSINQCGDRCVKLLCSKSKVAPLKKLSLPRLELCAALLLARLSHKVLSILNVNVSFVHLWTDSTIVLAWISEPPSKWKTFVANRVAVIQNKTNNAHWSHVKSQENPADLISRGVTPEQFKNSKIWWNGPLWLYNHDKFPAKNSFENVRDVPEQRAQIINCFTNIPLELDVISKFSSLAKLQRIVAYCLRFINACRKQNNVIGILTTLELRAALNVCIKHVQFVCFKADINNLNDEKSIPKKSELRSLTPFLDTDGLLRVGGRLHNSLLSYNSKFPIILPSRHHLTEMIVMCEHLRLLHANQQLLICSLRQRFWIPRIRQVVKNIINKCITCFKFKAETAKQQMGILPSPRVQPSRPFLNCGVDYAGPVMLKPDVSRSRLSIKAYISIFVCLATKAVHIELVTSLSTEAFIAAFRRFVSRRGRCLNLYSDNGTNFVGANNHLKDLGRFLQSKEEQGKLEVFAASEEFSWHFIPPSAPHFGGLWEASVKSMKYHLRRSAGNKVFNFEEMNTLLSQIEACLNSRSLTPTSNNPDEFSFLTPGHFLIGDHITFLPDFDYCNVPFNRLSRWQHVQRVMQLLWKRWSTEYLHGLQQRNKWADKDENLKPGKLVSIKEECPPLQWLTGYIEEVHPGADGLVRVVTLRTP